VFLWDESQDDAGERFMTPEPMAKVELSLRRPKGLCRGIGGPGSPGRALSHISFTLFCGVFAS
jgi:hypothetical protein